MKPAPPKGSFSTYRVKSTDIIPYGIANLGHGNWCFSSPASSSIHVVNSNGQTKRHDLTTKLKPVDLLRQNGHATLYEATNSGISCQSCHLKGDHDGNQHNIGQILRATMTIRGVSGTAPYFRTAAYKNLDSIHQISNGLLRGYKRSAKYNRTEALASYIDHLPRRVNPYTLSDSDSMRMKKGYASFLKASCQQCHQAPAFSNFSQVPAKMVFPDHWSGSKDQLLDVPSLLLLSNRSSYFVNNRTKDLNEVIRKDNALNTHGNTDALSEMEKQDLVYFLERI